MFIVNDIWDEAKQIIGVCDDQKLFNWLADGVSLVANKADLEGWKGFLDICTCGCSCTSASPCNNSSCGRRWITLPREVDTVIGVNIGGQPAMGYHQLFEYHLNGMGSCRTGCEQKWTDQGKTHSTFRDLITPAKLVAYTSTKEDDGALVVAYGYDKKGNVLRREESGVWMNGIRVPTIFGVALPAADSPEVARVTGVYKDETVGNIRLSTIDDSGSTGVLLGIYEPDETTPQYRRILINRSADWVRIAYLKTNPKFNSKFDHIPLRSRIALLCAVRACKAYADLQVADAHTFEADAARMEIEAQSKAEPPVYMPIQVVDGMSRLRDNSDYDIR